MNRFRLTLAGLAVVLLGLAACRDSQRTGQNDQSVPVDSGASRAADSTAPGIQSDTLKAGANDWILIPGEAAGTTHINGDLSEIIARFGRPDAGDAAMQKSVSVWYTNHDTTANSVAVYASRDAGNDDVARIRQIRVTAPRFETVSGVRVGTHERDIRSYYTVRDVEQFPGRDGTISKVLDAAEGIAFEIGSDGICDAIIIHAPGADRYGSYLKLRY